MATPLLSTQSKSSQPLLNSESFEDQNSEEEDLEEMPRPWRHDLPNFQPKIAIDSFYDAPDEDQEILQKLQKTCEDLSSNLLSETTLQSQGLVLHRNVRRCVAETGSEAEWIFSCVEPTLRLALDLSGLQNTVRIKPLRTTSISPSSLLPKWMGEEESRKIDIGLMIKLDDDAKHRILNFPNQENKGGIGPSETDMALQTHPLFCHIEVKELFQVVDPVVQLGVWTSAVYTRWEQVKETLQGSSKRDFPTCFGWTIIGYYWYLHLIRRLPDGSRQITENSRVYDTRSPSDLYLVVATLCHLIEYGHQEFREQFLDSVLDIRAQR